MFIFPNSCSQKAGVFPYISFPCRVTSQESKNSRNTGWKNGLTSCSFLFVVGYRHPSPAIVARTVRILHTLLTLVNKHRNCDKFEVNTQSVAYLAGKSTKQTKLILPNLSKNICQSFSWLLGGVKSSESSPVVVVKILSFAKTFFLIKELALKSEMHSLCHLWLKTPHGSLFSVITSEGLSLASLGPSAVLLTVAFPYIS